MIHALVAPIDWVYLPSVQVLELVFWITVAVGVLALVGLLTNLTLGLFTIGNVFLQGFLYSFGDFHHGEAVVMIALVVLALSPSGRALSIDSLWRDLRTARRQCRFEPAALLCEELEVAGLDWLNGYTSSTT